MNWVAGDLFKYKNKLYIYKGHMPKRGHSAQDFATGKMRWLSSKNVKLWQITTFVSREHWPTV